ncbi:Transcription factor LHW [Linum grandiflorum]
MGMLLREVLKTLCGVNQWSYAVFWKIGYQNPKLLIWEESYYESGSPSSIHQVNSGANKLVSPFGEWEGFVGSDAQSSLLGLQAIGGVHSLVNKMMMDSQVVILGEGIVGRAAFTGNHDWVNANSYTGHSHPPEVINEIRYQFSAGMQTIAVIPVCPHGVVQFGSSLPIAENAGFVNNVKSLILQLGCVPGALLSDDHQEKDLTERIGIPVSFGLPSFPHLAGIPSSTSFLGPKVPYRNAKNEVNGGAANSMYHHPITSHFNTSNPSHFGNTKNAADGFTMPNGIGNLISPYPSNANTSDGMFADSSSCRFNPVAVSVNHSRNLAPQETKQKMDNELFQALNLQSNQPNGPASCEFTDVGARDSFGNDLYDILGVDFRNKLLNGKWNPVISDGSQESSEIFVQDSTKFRNENGPNSCVQLPAMGTDHLLDAVVSRAQSSAKQNSDDSNSCRTTLTKASTLSDQVKKEFLNLSGSVGRGRTTPKDDTGSCSQTTSVYGSQLSSLSSHNGRRDSNNNVSTAYSKKAEESSKPNRKRLKPGENPKPRPKDRQMIQDRVKELREIVPNGAKCSIDALLERTIKHMLFLQSVTKHADKLKQSGESKLIRKDGGLRVKDNFDGGATWAFEVGSQSMVCPIVVEDLNLPRQMLVEMLCEERGFFLEIAELIRGLGLTILKGVMEVRSDKVWARFIVEANRDVTRMEIFMSLVHLLEQTMKGSGSSSATNVVENSHHAFGQASRPISL